MNRVFGIALSVVLGASVLSFTGCNKEDAAKKEADKANAELNKAVKDAGKAGALSDDALMKEAQKEAEALKNKSSAQQTKDAAAQVEKAAKDAGATVPDKK
jgi:hypothetical protein